MNNQWRDHAECLVVWADGTYDRGRKCDSCDGPHCNMPVHKDRYQTIGQENYELENNELSYGYWDWMHVNQPLGSKRDHDGDIVTPEFFTANPDGLPEVNNRSSGVTAEQYEWMQEAYEQLSPAQKEIWDMVQRDQMSLTGAALKLGITKQSADSRLQRAKLVVTNYLRTKQDNANS